MRISRKVLVDKEFQVCRDYQNGLSSRQIGKKYGHSQGSVLRILKENNTKLKSSQKYYYNENYFANIDVPQKAYWAGFIAADGWLSLNTSKKQFDRMCIKLMATDEKHLEKLREALSSNCPIKRKFDYHWRKTELVEIRINSKNICQDLNRIGIGCRKTYTLKFPNLSSRLIKHFILGYWDGDGGIAMDNRNNLVFYCSGRYDFLKNIQNILVQECKVGITKLYQIGSIFNLQYGGNKQVPRIMDYLYRDASVYLDRKHQKYLDFCNN